MSGLSSDTYLLSHIARSNVITLGDCTYESPPSSNPQVRADTDCVVNDECSSL